MQKNMQLPGLHTSQLRLWRRWALFGQWWWHLQLLLFRCSTWIAAMPGEMFSSFLDLRTSRWVNATSHLEIFKRETGNFTLHTNINKIWTLFPKVHSSVLTRPSFWDPAVGVPSEPRITRPTWNWSSFCSSFQPCRSPFWPLWDMWRASAAMTLTL